MTLRIRNALLAVSPVRERVHDVADVPREIRLGFLEELDPHIWDCHRKTVIKPDAAVGN